MEHRIQLSTLNTYHDWLLNKEYNQLNFSEMCVCLQRICIFLVNLTIYIQCTMLGPDVCHGLKSLAVHA
jgi:hypothetical protein